MTTPRLEVFDRAAALPPAWDVAATGHVFLRRENLRVLEETNPCGQRYHLAVGPSPSIAVTYRHRLNLLSFGIGSFKLPVTIVGLPCSVSSPGYHLAPETRAALLQHLHEGRGVTVVLNADDVGMPPFAAGLTLPTHRLELRWKTFDDYLASMRSHYRYRAAKALARWAPVVEATCPRARFDDGLYQLYVNVFTRARYPLEQLRPEFFRTFPADITTFSVEGRPLAFTQTLRDGDQLTFMFVGMEGTERGYDTYLNVLLALVRQGIEAGCRRIEFGQTTEVTKGKLGCLQVSKGLHVGHSNPLANRMVGAMAGRLSYRAEPCEYHVFR